MPEEVVNAVFESASEWFGAPGNSAFASFLVACVALALSVFNTVRQVRSDRRARAKTRKAILSAKLARELGSRHIADRLRISNDGASEARNLVVIMDDLPLQDHPAFPEGQSLVSTVPPMGDISYVLAISHDSAPPFKVRLTWSDDSKEPGSVETVITY